MPRYVDNAYDTISKGRQTREEQRAAAAEREAEARARFTPGPGRAYNAAPRKTPRQRAAARIPKGALEEIPEVTPENVGELTPAQIAAMRTRCERAKDFAEWENYSRCRREAAEIDRRRSVDIEREAKAEAKAKAEKDLPTQEEIRAAAKTARETGDRREWEKMKQQIGLHQPPPGFSCTPVRLDQE